MTIADEASLLRRARALGGLTVGEVAARWDRVVPREAKRAKGLPGTLVERALGVGGSAPGPDLPALGIEIKTLPVDDRGVPTESTFVCVAPHDVEPTYLESRVRAKLARVLFVPVTTSSEPAARRFGSAFLWSPSDEEDALLRADWELLTELLARDEPDAIRAQSGRALQLRPKARDGSTRVRSADAEGAPTRMPRRGYYVRRWFTAHVVARAGLAPPGERSR